MPESRWGDLGDVFIMSLSVFLGAFVSGLAPIFISLNQQQLALFNAFGTGLLLGTALTVIIPEGVEMLHDRNEEIMKLSLGVQPVHGMNTNDILGLALVVGLLFMLIVDNCGEGSHGHSHINRRRSLSDLLSVELETVQEEENETSDIDSVVENDLTRKNGSFTIGLIIHAAADGIALGASQAASKQEHRIGFVVFIAIVAHKVPAAFAFTVYLRNCHFPLESIKESVLKFSLASPIANLLTYLLLSESFFGAAFISNTVVSFVLLFSGGTFLYVALVHAFGELPRENGFLSKTHLLALSVGSMVPWFLSAGHQHD